MQTKSQPSSSPHGSFWGGSPRIDVKMALSSILLIRSGNTADNDQTPSLPHTLPVVIVVIVVINGRLVCPPAAALQTSLAHGLSRESLRPVDMKLHLGAVFSFLQHQNLVSESTCCQQDTFAKFSGITY